MKARIEKYHDDKGDYLPKRTRKNEHLYEEIKEAKLDNLSIGSNAKVIAEQNQIDIDKIKEILEKNYQEPPRRRSSLATEVEEQNYDLEKTREYDINAILEKAREEKEVDYQEERLKKVRDTQYDILKNLNLQETPEDNKAANPKTKEELLDLINTINLNEHQQIDEFKALKEEILDEVKPMDPLDILSDLRGNENTVVMGAKDFEDATDNATQGEESLSEPIKEEDKLEDSPTEVMDQTFYDGTMTFTKDDFADFDDIDAENKIGSFLIKFLIIIIFVAILAGIILFLNDFLKLGWF